MWHFRAYSGEEAFCAILRRLRSANVVSPRNLGTRELLNVAVEFDNIFKPLVTNPWRKINYAFAFAEVAWIAAGRNDLEYLLPFNKNMQKFSDDGKTLTGAYGPKIKSQMEYVINTLKADPDSRQAVMTIWKPSPKPSKDIPCTIMMHFIIRGGWLHLTTYMRSNDIWLGFPYDVFTFTTLLRQASFTLNVRCGTYTHIVGSMHIYEHNFNDIAPTLKYSNQKLRDMSSLPSITSDYSLARMAEYWGLYKNQPVDMFCALGQDLLYNYRFKNYDKIPEPFKTLRREAKELHARIKNSLDSSRS
jgi:thymidylate synthase